LFADCFFGGCLGFLAEIVSGALEHFVENVAGESFLVLGFNFGFDERRNVVGFYPIGPGFLEHFAVVIAVYFGKVGEISNDCVGEIEVERLDFDFFGDVVISDSEHFGAIVFALGCHFV
jgi:hypothetical protein